MCKNPDNYSIDGQKWEYKTDCVDDQFAVWIIMQKFYLLFLLPDPQMFRLPKDPFSYILKLNTFLFWTNKLI